MSRNDIHGIEAGWSVKSRDDEEVGTVEETTDRYILVSSGLVSKTRRYLPAAVLAHVLPDMGEIAISLTKDEVEGGDWSKPPAHGPRSEGAPLNPDYVGDGDTVPRRSADPGRPAN